MAVPHYLSLLKFLLSILATPIFPSGETLHDAQALLFSSPVVPTITPLTQGQWVGSLLCYFVVLLSYLKPFFKFCVLPERVKGIEPSSAAWKAVALPLSYTRKYKGFKMRYKDQMLDRCLPSAKFASSLFASDTRS